MCIVTEYAKGGDLKSLIAKKKHFEEEEALEYFGMILLGVHFIHSKNIVHRDLKPANILLDELGSGMKIPKIGDFGISKIELETMMNSGTTLGHFTTPDYQAPEVIEKHEPTKKVDIWALGVIFYELLSQRHPFK